MNAERLPHWPYRMKADLAASYCGMSIASFRRAIEVGELHEGKKKTGGVFWLRHDLEKCMELADTKNHIARFDKAI